MVALITESSLQGNARPAARPVTRPSTRPELRLIRGGLDVPQRDHSVLIAVAAVLAVVAAVLGLRMVQGQPPADGSPVTASVAEPNASEAVHVVAAGDTLWAIAESLAPGRDPRPVVDALAARNGGTALRAGDLLVIPSELLLVDTGVGLASGPLSVDAP